ncbi:hypothetical protein PRK78_003297 [Emydomyces testavorans]|uniref:SET domain-containing protein n=1 Tax=Emydomyces testavorans TaxID=2070801 RepID=A0AAF0DHU2_9EURO|nr:hypothetical protein PRK78_003297 [Emydomyces testavorans]
MGPATEGSASEQPPVQTPSSLPLSHEGSSVKTGSSTETLPLVSHEQASLEEQSKQENSACRTIPQGIDENPLTVPSSSVVAAGEKPQDTRLPGLPSGSRCIARTNRANSIRDCDLPTVTSRAITKGGGWLVGELGDTKGRGLLSMTYMPRGHLIAHEPVMVVDETLESMNGSIQDYNRMLAERLREVNHPNFVHFFFKLKKSSEEEFGKFGAYFEKTCIPCPLSSAEKVRVVGPAITYINHSCNPNAQQTLVESEIRGKKCYFVDIRACRNIRPGEEITVSYEDIYVDVAARKEYMKQHFGFECACQFCANVNSEFEEDLAVIDRALPIARSPHVGIGLPAKAFKLFHQIISKLIRHGLLDRRYCDIMAHCAKISAFHSDAGRAIIFLNAAQSGFFAVQGYDGPDMWILLEAEANITSFAYNPGSERGLSTQDDAEIIGTLDSQGCIIAFMLEVDDKDYLRLADAKRLYADSEASEPPKRKAREEEPESMEQLLESLSLEKKEHDEARFAQNKGKGRGKKRQNQTKAGKGSRSRN